jgi:hypothetical protein
LLVAVVEVWATHLVAVVVAAQVAFVQRLLLPCRQVLQLQLLLALVVLVAQALVDQLLLQTQEETQYLAQ